MGNSSQIERLFEIEGTITFTAGAEWVSLSSQEIVELILRHVDQIVNDTRLKHESEVVIHKTRHWLVRKWKEMRGWEPTPTLDKDEALRRIVRQCHRLSREMFVLCNQIVFVDKPKEVARKLEEIISS